MSQAVLPRRSITTEPFHGTVTVRFAGVVVAHSPRALVLREGSYSPVFYVPFADISFDLLERTETSTHCPYKGMASYWKVAAGGGEAKDAMWAYETPIAAVSVIAGHGAFDQRHMHVEAIAEGGEPFAG